MRAGRSQRGGVAAAVMPDSSPHAGRTGIVLVDAVACGGDAHEQFYDRCPIALANRPDVQHVHAFWRESERGQGAMLEPAPSAQMMRAASMFDAEVAAWRDWDLEQKRKHAEAGGS